MTPQKRGSSQVPVCVDLDGSLLKTDLLIETFLALIKRRPWLLAVMPFWIFRGKAHVKARIAALVDLDPGLLPYHTGLLEWLKAEHSRGRTLVLATASHEKLASRVAGHLGIFDRTFASTSELNLSGHNKRDVLVRHFGERGFDYVGNGHVDLKIWSAARHAILVSSSAGLRIRANKLAVVERVFDDGLITLPLVAKAMRLHQWAKNVLVFVPLFAAHQVRDIGLLSQAALAFLVFGLCASSVYLLNDLLDLAADRSHTKKRHRPFASGRLPLKFGLALIPGLLVTSVSLAAVFLPIWFLLALLAYYVCTLIYSFWGKNRVVIDVMFLAGLYTIRIIAGAAATGVILSFWLMAFSMFLFLSLALVKRYAEFLEVLGARKSMTAGRGYHVEDLSLLQSFGVAAGYMAVLVLALYINSEDMRQLYATPVALWVLCLLLLFWISRVWMKTHRGEMHDDPVVFAIKDRVSLVTGVACGIVLWVASI